MGDSSSFLDYPKSTFVLSYLLLVLWLIVGMFAFSCIESPSSRRGGDATLTTDLSSSKESEVVLTMDVVKNSVTQVLVENVNVLSISQYTNATSTFVVVVFTKTKSNKAISSNRWDLVSSLFFSMSIVTTIGYGNLAPATDFGKIFGIFYATIGIPICFNAIGLIRRGTLKLINRFRTCLTERLQKCSPATKNLKIEEINNSIRVTALFVTVMLTLLAYYITLTASSGIINSIEGWGYFSSLYYVFISISTIGFGDLIAGQNAEIFGNFWTFAVYRIFLAVFIFFGIAFASVLLHVAQSWTRGLVSSIIQFTIYRFSQREFVCQQSAFTRPEDTIPCVYVNGRLVTKQQEQNYIDIYV